MSKKIELKSAEQAVEVLSTIVRAGITVRTADRETWLAARRFGIGGSDAGAVLGVNPYAGPHDVWLDKTGRETGTRESEAMLWGTVLEEPIAAEFSRRTGLKVVRDRFMRFHDNGIMYANIDRRIVGLVDGKKAILEVKTAGLRVAHQWGPDGTDQVPDHYLVQCQSYLACTGADLAMVACLIGGQELRIYRVERDAELIAAIEEAVVRFWKHVEEDTPPGDSPNPAIAALIHGLKPRYEDAVVAPEASDLVAEIKAVQAEIKKAKVREDELKGRLCDLIGEHEAVLAEEGAKKPLATWKYQERETLDSRALKKAHPEIAADFMKKSQSRVLRIA